MRTKLSVLLVLLAFGALFAQVYLRLLREREHLEESLTQRRETLQQGWADAWRRYLTERANDGTLTHDYALEWNRSGKRLLTAFFPEGRVTEDWAAYRAARTKGDGKDRLTTAFTLTGTWDRVLALQEWQKRYGAWPDGTRLSPFERSQFEPEAGEAYRRMFRLMESGHDFTLAASAYGYDGAFYRVLPNGNLEAMVPSLASIREKALPGFLSMRGIRDAHLGASPWDVTFDPEVGLDGAYPRRELALLAAFLVLLATASWLYFSAALAERRQLLRRIGFLGQVVHELKTPLAGAQLHLQLMRRAGVGGDSLDAAGVAVGRMDRLFSEIVALHRPHEAATGLNLSPDELMRIARASAADTSTNITVAGACTTAVRGEEARLKLVLANLLGNAIHYGGAARLTIAEDPEFVSLTVDDDGPGVAWPDRTRVFQEFYRAETARASRPGGLGLGLAIAKKLAKEMGAELALLNPGDPGARFRLTLRRAP